jgi:hypothetical protein
MCQAFGSHPRLSKISLIARSNVGALRGDSVHRTEEPITPQQSGYNHLTIKRRDMLSEWAISQLLVVSDKSVHCRVSLVESPIMVFHGLHPFKMLSLFVCTPAMIESQNHWHYNVKQWTSLY